MGKPAPTDQYWFRAKEYGWGWGLPCRWQGWLVMGLFLVGTTAGGVAAETLDSPWGDITAVVLMGSSLVGLLVACFRKGEPPKWRWGSS